MRELKDEVGKLNSTRNKVIGGCVAVSATTALLIAILRLVPADPPVIQIPAAVRHLSAHPRGRLAIGTAEVHFLAASRPAPAPPGR